MYRLQKIRYAASTFVVVMILFGCQISFAQAASLVSDAQIKEQKLEVISALVETLEQDVKLLQMLLIRKLEARVAYLQTLVANQ